MRVGEGAAICELPVGSCWVLLGASTGFCHKFQVSNILILGGGFKDFVVFFPGKLGNMIQLDGHAA